MLAPVTRLTRIVRYKHAPKNTQINGVFEGSNRWIQPHHLSLVLKLSRVNRPYRLYRLSLL